MNNRITWFEIPVVDLPRATRFYETVLGATLKTEDFFGTPMAIMSAKGVGGALVKMAQRQPSGDGALVYLNADGALDAMLARVEGAGGRIVMKRTEIGPQGSIAMVRDTEGNQVGLHQER